MVDHTLDGGNLARLRFPKLCMCIYIYVYISIHIYIYICMV